MPIIHLRPRPCRSRVLNAAHLLQICSTWPSPPLHLLLTRRLNSNYTSSSDAGMNSPKPTPLLENQRAIITGGSRGIGLSVARLLSSHGASCLLISRDASSLESAVRSLPSPLIQPSLSSSLSHSFLPGSVSDPSLWETVKKQEKQVDILVNAAGIGHSNLLLSTSVDIIQQILGTNLLGTILGCKAVYGGMVKRGKGDIVNVASVYGIRGGGGTSVYAGSKSGVIGFTRALSDEVARKGVKVNCVSPGWIETDMTKAINPEKKEKIRQLIPGNKMGTPEEVAEAVLFLITNQLANGTNLVLDGGVAATLLV